MIFVIASMKVLSLLLRNVVELPEGFVAFELASMKVLSLLLRNAHAPALPAPACLASMKVLSLLLRNIMRPLVLISQSSKPQ